MKFIVVILIIAIILFFLFRKGFSGFSAKTTVNDKLSKKYSKLNREATALKKEGKIDDAIDKLKDAYAEAEKRKLTLTVKDYMRLPPFLQQANRNDEAWAWFNKLIQECAGDYMSLSEIYGKMRLFRQREIAHKDAIKYSVIQNDWTWLGRSGALLAAFGVVLAYLDISGFMSKITDAMKVATREVLLKNDKTVKEEALKEIKSVIDDVNKSIVDNLTFIEFFTIFCGTIIWGYGDKFPYIFS